MRYKILLAFFGIILGVVLMLIIPLLRISDHFYINYNEGWNAYHAVLSRSNNLYGNLFTPVNYPPLSFYFLGLFPEPLIAGRIVSLVALFINCFFISLLVYKSTKNRFASVISGALSLGIFLGLAQYYVGMDDPQLMAQAIMLFGFVLYYFRKNLIVVALFIAIALFIKQNLLAMPLAIAFDLFWTSKKGFFTFIGSLLVFGLFGIIGSQVLSHGQFLTSILVKRELTFSNVMTLIKITILPIFPVFIVGFFYKKRDIFMYYFIASILVGLFFSIGSGVDVNINFDVFLSLSILLGILLAKKKNILFIILLQIILLVGVRIYQHNLYYLVGQQEAKALKIISLIRKAKGDVLCEDIELCYFAGKPFVYDPYLIEEEVKTGKIKESQIVNLVKNKRFDLIEIHSPLQKEQDKFTPKFMVALGDNYNFINSLYYPKK